MTRIFLLLSAILIAGCSTQTMVVADIAELPDGSIGVKRCPISVSPFPFFPDTYIEEDECTRKELGK